jgi:hypothetical protein
VKYEKRAVACSTCDDTHVMHLRGDAVMCTRCPVPCQKCRAGGTGAFCERTPCACECHNERHPDTHYEPRIELD